MSHKHVRIHSTSSYEQNPSVYLLIAEIFIAQGAIFDIHTSICLNYLDLLGNDPQKIQTIINRNSLKTTKVH